MRAAFAEHAVHASHAHVSVCGSGELLVDEDLANIVSRHDAAVSTQKVFTPSPNISAPPRGTFQQNVPPAQPENFRKYTTTVEPSTQLTYSDSNATAANGMHRGVRGATVGFAAVSDSALSVPCVDEPVSRAAQAPRTQAPRVGFGASHLSSAVTDISGSEEPAYTYTPSSEAIPRGVTAAPYTAAAGDLSSSSQTPGGSITAGTCS